MGDVYLARHPRLPRHDALKVLPLSVSSDEEFRTRFEREADFAGTLWHLHHSRPSNSPRSWTPTMWAAEYRLVMADRFAVWNEITGTTAA